MIADILKNIKQKQTEGSADLLACPHCGSKFKKESTLYIHMCEKKRRALAVNDKNVRIGFTAFNRFFKLTQNVKHEKSYEEFCKSQFYNAFVKFGSFVSNVNPLYPDKYIDYVVTSGVKLDHWCREQLYYDYVLDLIKKEPADVALQRSVTTMTDWAETTGSDWARYFTEVSANRAVYDIKDGKMSPWLLLNCKSGKAMLAKFNDEQLEIVYPVLDPQYWAARFPKFPSDIALIKEVAEAGGL